MCQRQNLHIEHAREFIIREIRIVRGKKKSIYFRYVCVGSHEIIKLYTQLKKKKNRAK